MWVSRAVPAVSFWEGPVQQSLTQADEAGLYAVKTRPRRQGGPSTWFLRLTTVCLALAGAIVLLDLAISWTAALSDSDGRSADPAPIAVTVGGQRLAIPGNMIRFENQRTGGPQERVDLAVHWPSLSGYDPSLKAAFLDETETAPLLFLTIRKRETATDSAGRLASVYQHFFEGAALPAPAGLVGHRLSEDSGLKGEEVFFEAGSTSPFTVHCLAADDSGYPAPCLTEIHAGDGLSVQIRFRKGLLGDWAGIKKASRALLMTYGLLS